MNKKIAVYAGIVVVVLVGGYFLLSKGVQQGVTQALNDRDTTVAKKFMQGSGELNYQARDAQRISDVAKLKKSISLYITDVQEPVLCKDKKVYKSDDGSTAVDGTGWLPIDFTKIKGGSPIASLPQDPVNEEGLVYSYACHQEDLTFEIDTALESSRYGTIGNEDDVVSTDGGNNSRLYETGNAPDLNLIP